MVKYLLFECAGTENRRRDIRQFIRKKESNRIVAY